MTFPAKAPDEVVLVTFDFVPEMPTINAVISSPDVVVLEVVSGSGATGDVTFGPQNVDGQTVKVLVHGGIDGTKYRLSCEVDVDNGEHRRIDKDLPVKEKGALV